jgi:hypothetical protein
MDIRLETHLTSFATPAGTAFRSVVIAPLEVGGKVLAPQGTIVHGTVRRSHSVGIGLRRERAFIDLEFRGYELPDGRRVAIRAQVLEVDNAREEVTSKGGIKGVLAASGANALFNGFWHRPQLGLFHRSALGLTGAGGAAWTRLSLGPAGVAGLFAVRLAVLRMPDPEIHLKPGTEMKIKILSLPEDAPSFDKPANAPLPEALGSWLQDQPFEVTRTSGKLTEDLINLAFIGSEHQLISAFEAAGWSTADTLTRRTFALSYKAWTRMHGYPTAPVSTLLYQDAKPALVFQKSLNSVAKRHHVRIWDGGEIDGERLWLAAGTHDTGIILNRRVMGLTHKISPYLDQERSKVTNDLAFAGCIEGPAYVDRRDAVRVRQKGKGVSSDGKLAVMTLRECAPPVLLAQTEPTAKPSRAKRVARRFLLETRNYLLRANVYYYAYKTFRPSPKPVETEEAVVE